MAKKRRKGRKRRKVKAAKGPNKPFCGTSLAAASTVVTTGEGDELGFIEYTEDMFEFLEYTPEGVRCKVVGLAVASLDDEDSLGGTIETMDSSLISRDGGRSRPLPRLGTSSKGSRSTPSTPRRNEQDYQSHILRFQNGGLSPKAKPHEITHPMEVSRRIIGDVDAPVMPIGGLAVSMTPNSRPTTSGMTLSTTRPNTTGILSGAFLPEDAGSPRPNTTSPLLPIPHDGKFRYGKAEIPYVPLELPGSPRGSPRSPSKDASKVPTRPGIPSPSKGPGGSTPGTPGRPGTTGFASRPGSVASRPGTSSVGSRPGTVGVASRPGTVGRPGTSGVTPGQGAVYEASDGVGSSSSPHSSPTAPPAKPKRPGKVIESTIGTSGRRGKGTAMSPRSKKVVAAVTHKNLAKFMEDTEMLHGVVPYAFPL